MAEQPIRRTRWTTYTMGHQGMNMETFLSVLGKYKIHTVLDVRASPNSNKTPDWKLAKLKSFCTDHGYKYKWKGQHFGGAHQTQQLISNLNDPENGSMFLRSTFNLIDHPVLILGTSSNYENCSRKYISDALIVHNLSTIYHITSNGDSIQSVKYERPHSSKIKVPQIEEEKEDESKLPTDDIVENTEIEFIQKFPKEMIRDKDFDGRRNSMCIIPPSSIWPRIQAIRKKHDAAYTRWQPHFNILYPFVAEKYFPSQLEHIENALKGISPFHVELKEFSYFDKQPNAKDPDPSCYVFLKATKESEERFQEIYDAVTGLYPCCATKKNKNGFKAHLTMGQFPRSKCKEWVEMMNAEWQPIAFQCDSVALISRTGDLPFQIRHRVPLKLGGSDSTPFV